MTRKYGLQLADDGAAISLGQERYFCRAREVVNHSDVVTGLVLEQVGADTLPGSVR
jgi:hypothetical protein